LDPSGAQVTGDNRTVTLTIGDNAEADWQYRRTLPFCTFDQDFSNPSAVTPFLFDNGGDEVETGKVSVDTSDRVPGTLGNCLKIFTPATWSGTQSGTYRHPLNRAWNSNAQGVGANEYYVCYRVKVDAGRLVFTPGQGGWKWFIFAYFNHNDPQNSVSSQHASFVGQDENYRGFPQYYTHTNSVTSNWLVTVDGLKIKLQNAIDRGIGLPDNERYCLYGTNYAGCFVWPVDEWINLQFRVRYNNPGGFGNEFTAWAALRGASQWTKTHEVLNHEVGSFDVAGYTNGPNGMHWTNYMTGRTTSPVDATIKYAEILVGTQMFPVPKT